MHVGIFDVLAELAGNLWLFAALAVLLYVFASIVVQEWIPAHRVRRKLRWHR